MFKIVRLAFRLRNIFKFSVLWLKVVGLHLYLRRPSFSKKGLLGILLITLAAGIMVGQVIAVQRFERYADRLQWEKAVLMEKNRDKANLIADLETQLGLKQGKGKKVGWK